MVESHQQCRAVRTMSCNVPIRAVTRGPKHHFFGYYDKSPWDLEGRWMLALEVDFMDRPPKPGDAAIIGLVDLKEDSAFCPIAQTHAWNWQQGAMLQWLPGTSRRLIIYNSCQGGSFVSVIRDLDGGEERTLPLPVYTISHSGRWALTPNFSR